MSSCEFAHVRMYVCFFFFYPCVFWCVSVKACVCVSVSVRSIHACVSLHLCVCM